MSGAARTLCRYGRGPIFFPYHTVSKKPSELAFQSLNHVIYIAVSQSAHCLHDGYEPRGVVEVPYSLTFPIYAD